MPELPDVRVFKEYLDATALHHTVERTEVRDESLLRDVTRQTLARRLKDAELESSRRHGKHLLVRLDAGDWLTLHFGMTGFLRYYGADRAEDREPDHVRLPPPGRRPPARLRLPAPAGRGEPDPGSQPLRGGDGTRVSRRGRSRSS